MTRNQNTNSGSREIPIKKVSKFSLSDDKLRHQRIAEKAYERYECRGCCHGRDLDDRLEAERLVLSGIESQAHGKAENPRPRGQRSKKG